MPIVSSFKRLNKCLFLFITVDVTVQPQIKTRSRETNVPPLWGSCFITIQIGFTMPIMTRAGCFWEWSQRKYQLSWGNLAIAVKKLTVHINFILVGPFGIHISPCVDIYSLYRGILVIVDTTAAPVLYIVGQKYSYSLCSSLKYTNS